MWLRINKIIKSLKGIFEYLEHKFGNWKAYLAEK